jgi:hypothetical protein
MVGKVFPAKLPSHPIYNKSLPILVKMKISILSKLTLIVVLLHSTVILSAQLSLDWALTQGSNDSDLTGSCKIDDQGYLYTTVAFRDTIDLDPGPGENMVYVADDEIFVLNKYTQDGEYVWASQFKTNGDAAGSITEIRNNRIVMIVYYTDTLTYIHHTPWTTANPGKHMAVISMNLDGQIISFQHLANTNDLYFSDFVTQSDGSFLSCGGFEGAVTFTTPDSTKTVTSAGEYDAFIARFNANLEVEWFTLLASPGDDFAESIYVGHDDRIYFAMIHDSTITFQTNHGQVVSPADGEDNAVFGWLKSDGTIEAAYLFGGDLGDQLRTIAADENDNIYISGYFEGEVNFQHPSGTPVVYTSVNESDGFVAKYTSDGSLVWARIFTNEDYGGVYTMRLHRDTHLYLTGSYTGISDLDPGPDSLILDGGPQGDLFACKLDTDGNLTWVYSFPGIGFNGIRNLIPAPDGKLFIHGYYFNTIDYDPGPKEQLFHSQGGSDVFVIGFTEENVVTSSSDAPSSSILIFPNPAKDFVEIKTDSPIEFVEVYSSNGTRILHTRSDHQLATRINVSSLPAGLFFLQVKTESQYITQKILITE